MKKSTSLLRISAVLISGVLIGAISSQPSHADPQKYYYSVSVPNPAKSSYSTLANVSGKVGGAAGAVAFSSTTTGVGLPVAAVSAVVGGIAAVVSAGAEIMAHISPSTITTISRCPNVYCS